MRQFLNMAVNKKKNGKSLISIQFILFLIRNPLMLSIESIMVIVWPFRQQDRSSHLDLVA